MGADPGPRAAVSPRTLLATLAILALGWLWLTRPWLFGGLTVPWDAEAHFRAQLEIGRAHV